MCVCKIQISTFFVLMFSHCAAYFIWRTLLHSWPQTQADSLTSAPF